MSWGWNITEINSTPKAVQFGKRQGAVLFPQQYSLAVSHQEIIYNLSISKGKAGGRMGSVQCTTFNTRVCAGSASDLPLCHALKLRFPNIIQGVLDVLPSQTSWFAVMFFRKSQKGRSEGLLARMEAETCVHTFIYTAWTYFTLHTAVAEKRGKVKEI